MPDPGDLLEPRVLWDADRLDETGAVGIVWSCINSGRSAAPSYEDAVYRITQNDLRHVELLVGRMKTETGKEIARERVAIIQSFVEELAREGVGRDGAGPA